MIATRTNHRTAIQFLFTPDGFTPDLSKLSTKGGLQEARNLMIGSGGESWITELGNDELMSLLRLG
ncbi:hypothetical protein GN277_06200 [Lachnospiraceae bacterium WCA-9-b2]|jgi:hypothetical protein|uniref:Uncharacterized protein n=1 Tax=Sporofaciens musculi TaxID=2681861 RepID=A0A7X3MEK2_9FIRM|nr:hypothetical protein [Sporofaciens musculi]MXP74986.1 hypothetical protein [Sporofaciens musculi]